ncbi:hypothetical protein Tco_0562156 [Tanacetum coccineum]
MAYSAQLNTVYRSSNTVTEAEFSYLIFVLDFMYYCSSEHILLIFLPLPQIILISSEKIEEVMADIQTKATMKELTTNDKANYYSGIASIMVNEDAVEHIKYFLKIVDPINLPNVNYEQLRLSVFPISLVGNAREWFDEFKSSITSWVDLTETFFGKYYPPSRTSRITVTKPIRDPSNSTFGKWLASKFANHMIMDPFTKKVLWNFWIKSYDHEEVADKGFFHEFNFILKVDPELFTHDIERTKTCEDYENELNDELGEPCSEDGVPYEIYDHICEPFRFKNGKAKWPTCNSNKDGFCNGGELPGMVRVAYMTYFQDYEWYNELADGNSMKEAIKQKAIYKKSWGNASQSVMNFCAWLKRNHIQGPYANYYRNFLDKEDHEDKDKHGLFNDQKRPVCNIRRFDMIKYSFGDDKEYVAIKEHEYDDLTSTNEDAYRTYQDIFHRIDEGWMNLAGKEIDKVGEVSII